MASVDAGYASWLKADARYVSATIAGAAAAFGDKALDSSTISPLALHDDAQVEAIRQAQFLAGPLARDKHVVKGQKAYLVGQPITLFNARLGYDQGPTVFVIDADESQIPGATILHVLKRL